MAADREPDFQVTEPVDEGRLHVRWRDVALLSLAIALGAVIAIIVLVAVGRAETLTTTVLVLAVVSFGVQFAAYAAASSDASRMLQQSMSIYAETRAALTRIQSTTSTTQETHLTLIQQLMAELREGAQKAEQQAGAQPDHGEVSAQLDALEQRLADLAARQPFQPAPTSTMKPRTTRTRGSQGALDRLKTPPSEEETPKIRAALDPLSDHETALLAALALSERRRREEGRPDLIPIWFNESQLGVAAVARALEEAGLVRTVATPTAYRQLEEPGEHWLALTPAGRTLAPVFTAEDPLPESLQPHRARAVAAMQDDTWVDVLPED